MGELREVLPVAGGVLAALLASRIAVPRLRYIVLAVAAVVLGVTATVISGEAAVSWAYLLVDIGEVVLAMVVTTVLLGVLGRQRTTQLH